MNQFSYCTNTKKAIILQKWSKLRAEWKFIFNYAEVQPIFVLTKYEFLNSKTMIFILWILRLIMPIVTIGGIIGIIGMVEESAETWLWVVSGVVAFLGFLLGLSSWGLTVPPRFFWVSSPLDAFESRITSSLGYALQFFTIVPCIWLICFWAE